MKWWSIDRGGGLVLGLGGIYSLKSSVFGISGNCSLWSAMRTSARATPSPKKKKKKKKNKCKHKDKFNSIKYD